MGTSGTFLKTFTMCLVGIVIIIITAVMATVMLGESVYLGYVSAEKSNVSPSKVIYSSSGYNISLTGAKYMLLIILFMLVLAIVILSIIFLAGVVRESTSPLYLE